MSRFLLHELLVDSGEVRSCREAGLLRASAIGSCVVVTAYDQQAAVGGMAHVMLPGEFHAMVPSAKTRYASNAVHELLQQIFRLGAEQSRLTVCLVGGGNVLGDGYSSPGPEIVHSLVALFAARGITPVAMDIGGQHRRSCILDVATGCVYYTLGDSTELLLWNNACQCSLQKNFRLYGELAA